jgi:hypothetical protein
MHICFRKMECLFMGSYNDVPDDMSTINQYD